VCANPKPQAFYGACFQAKTMNIQEKKERSRQFIASSEFTVATHTVLALFNRNAQNLLNTVTLEGILLDRIEKGEIDTGLAPDVLAETKSFVLLDGLAKIMMLTEGFFALCEALSNPKKGYKSLPETMARYDMREINDFIRRFKGKEIDVWNLFRFPKISELLIEPNEAVFIEKLFRDSCKVLETNIFKLIEFYECNRIPYYKLKHGLSIMAGMKVTGPKEGNFPSLLIYALDRWENKDPPCLCHKSKDSLMPEDLKWFDTISMVPYWVNTFKKHSEIMFLLRTMIEHLTSNHLDWASNCGKDYFPMKWTSETQCHPLIYLPYKLEGSDQALYDPVVQKICNNMNLARKDYNFGFNIPNEIMEKIFNSFEKNQVATIRGQQSGKSVTIAKVE
jgi:hypothetical protein